MIPSSRSSIFAGDLDSNGERETVCQAVGDMGVSLQRVQSAQPVERLHLEP